MKKLFLFFVCAISGFFTKNASAHAIQPFECINERFYLLKDLSFADIDPVVCDGFCRFEKKQKMKYQFGVWLSGLVSVGTAVPSIMKLCVPTSMSGHAAIFFGVTSVCAALNWIRLISKYSHAIDPDLYSQQLLNRLDKKIIELRGLLLDEESDFCLPDQALYKAQRLNNDVKFLAEIIKQARTLGYFYERTTTFLHLNEIIMQIDKRLDLLTEVILKRFTQNLLRNLSILLNPMSKALKNETDIQYFCDSVSKPFVAKSSFPLVSAEHFLTTLADSILALKDEKKGLELRLDIFDKIDTNKYFNQVYKLILDILLKLKASEEYNLQVKQQFDFLEAEALAKRAKEEHEAMIYLAKEKVKAEQAKIEREKQQAIAEEEKAHAHAMQAGAEAAKVVGNCLEFFFPKPPQKTEVDIRVTHQDNQNNQR